MPAPVMVATVAEPCRNPNNGGRHPGEQEQRNVRLGRPLANQIADLRREQHLLKSAPSTDNQNNRGDCREALTKNIFDLAQIRSLANSERHDSRQER